MYSPGFDTWRPVDCSPLGTIFGRKESVSFVPSSKVDQKILKSAISITFGAPMMEIASIDNDNVFLHLNNFKQSSNPQPLIGMGTPYRRLEILENGISEIFPKAYQYVLGFENDQFERSMGAILSLLHAHSGASPIEVRTMAILHFIEWFDKSKTFSKEKLKNRFSISSAEAQSIVSIRNDFVHARRDLSASINDNISAIIKSACKGNLPEDASDPLLTFFVYMLKICRDALLDEIGYLGERKPAI
jgi:hypothetical protein